MIEEVRSRLSAVRWFPPRMLKKELTKFVALSAKIKTPRKNWDN
jgi:hypothetical protein